MQEFPQQQPKTDIETEKNQQQFFEPICQKLN